MSLRPVYWTLFLLLWISLAWFHRADPSWNANSRLALTLALVERSTAQVDHYVTPLVPEEGRLPLIFTQDLAIYQGHYYSDKIIGTSLLGMPGYAVVLVMEGFAGKPFPMSIRHWLVAAFSVSLLGAGAGVLLFRLLALERECGRREADDAEPAVRAFPWGALAITLFTMFGTAIWLYSSLFMSYLPAVFFILWALWRFEKWRCVEQATGKGAPLFTCGLLMGLAVLCEYLAGIAAVFFGLYAVSWATGEEVWRKRALGLLRYAAGGFLGVLPFFIYTWVIFGQVSIPYQYHAHEMFRTYMARGFMGATLPDPDALVLLTVHPYRGLFVQSAWLIAAVAGVIWGIRRPKTKRLALLIAGVFVAQLLFNSAYYMWWGGWSFGPRHLIPAIPFLAVAAYWVWERGGKAVRGGIVALGLVSVFIHLVAGAVDPQVRDLYDPRTPLGMRLGWLMEPDLVENDYPWTFPVRHWPDFLNGRTELNPLALLAEGAGKGWMSVAPLILMWSAALGGLWLWERRRVGADGVDKVDLVDSVDSVD